MRRKNKYFYIIYWHMCRAFCVAFLINKITIVLRVTLFNSLVDVFRMKVFFFTLCNFRETMCNFSLSFCSFALSIWMKGLR